MEEENIIPKGVTCTRRFKGSPCLRYTSIDYWRWDIGTCKASTYRRIYRKPRYKWKLLWVIVLPNFALISRRSSIPWYTCSITLLNAPTTPRKMLVSHSLCVIHNFKVKETTYTVWYITITEKRYCFQSNKEEETREHKFDMYDIHNQSRWIMQTRTDCLIHQNIPLYSNTVTAFCSTPASSSSA